MHKTIPDYENCSEEKKMLYVIVNEGLSEEADLSYDLSDKDMSVKEWKKYFSGRGNSMQRS